VTTILLIGPEVVSLDKIRNWSAVWSYFLAGALRDRGATVRFAQRPDTLAEAKRITFAGVDLAVGLGVRGLSRYPNSLSHLRAVYRGKLAEIADRPHSMADDSRLSFSFSVCGTEPTSIGWAADPGLLVPKQPERTLRILIDHADYAQQRIAKDQTAMLVESALELRASDLWRGRWDHCVLRRQTDNGFETVDAPIRQGVFDRDGSVPWPKATEEYRAAHVFVVTHSESVGLTALECATAGALVVSPRGFLPRDRLNTIRHLEFSGVFSWQAVLDRIDVWASRRVAIQNSWAAVAERVLAHV
jgi:hypothetical protein